MANTALSRLEGSTLFRYRCMTAAWSGKATANTTILTTVSSHHLVLEVGAGVVLVGAGQHSAGSSSVTLARVNTDTSGRYTCEVSTN